MTDINSSDVPARADDIEALARLIKGCRVALLTTVTGSGDLHSRPLAVQDNDFDGDLWFFSQDPSPKMDDIRGNTNVNVSLESSNGFVSIAGTASIVHDAAKIDELWNTRAEAWFPEGRDDPCVSLVKVEAISAEYWATNEPKAVSRFRVAKATPARTSTSR